MSYIGGAGLTSFGRHEGSTTLSLMSDATREALHDAEMDRAEIDAVLCGYSGTQPHLMLANHFSEHFGITPSVAYACQVGGATGLALVTQAVSLLNNSDIETVLVVAGENRLTGQTRDASMQMLSQVGHARYEVPFGASVPAYYALLADRYLHKHSAPRRDLAELAVALRVNALGHPGAHLREAMTVDDVLASKAIASPLHLLDCCPISDGGAAILITSRKPKVEAVRIIGTGQAHLHQHLCATESLDRFGAAQSTGIALKGAGVDLKDIDYAGIYDSFTITLALLLEEIGLSEPGQAGADAADGRFAGDGQLPLNTHGGLLSYGHCGVAGGMGHFVEAYRQMAAKCGTRGCRKVPQLALVHADGGVMSAHISAVLERVA